ncbi:hypothetical protein BJY04DRAFT_220929 [Aspergillus karnatakaensis]|uniref:uncharacterized protein n=1 Tax=Aspergillus karnatakaensis TaxID=1810916 RepID=UPI003CCE4579
MPVGKDTEKSADPLMGSGSGAGMGSEMVDLGTSAYPDVLDGWSSFTAMLHGDMGDSKALTLTPTQMHLQASAPDLDPLQRQTQVRSTAQTQTQAHSQQNPEQDWEHNLEQELMRGMATKFGCRYPAGTLVSMSPERLVSLSGVKKKTSESGLEPVAPYKKLARRVTLPCLLEGEVVRDVRIRAQTEEAMRGLDEGMQRERESTGADGAGDAVGGGDGDGDDDGWLILVSLDGDYAEKEDKDSEIFLEIFSEDETEDEGVVV